VSAASILGSSGPPVKPKMTGYPLDLQTVAYSYLERPNRSLLWLLDRHVLRSNPAATILDVGCGCGANARAIKARHPKARVIGVEPDVRAAELAAQVADRVYRGTLEAWLDEGTGTVGVDVVVLSDVLEHIADPVAWLRSMAARPELRGATWIISVPNYGVWYNRLRTLAGRFEYTWSGLYDRTHLRFYTRKSIHGLLEYCGFERVADRCSPSFVQSLAPLLRRGFEENVASGDHLVLMNSGPFRLYQRFVEPVEEAVCNLWKALLGFQIVTVARFREAAPK
jgi:SAM-dependent methyltransferase